MSLHIKSHNIPINLKGLYLSSLISTCGVVRLTFPHSLYPLFLHSSFTSMLPFPRIISSSYWSDLCLFILLFILPQSVLTLLFLRNFLWRHGDTELSHTKTNLTYGTMRFPFFSSHLDSKQDTSVAPFSE